MKRIILVISCLSIFAGILHAQKPKIESIYTDLAAEKCKTVESDEGGAGFYRGECAGVGGYKLEVIEGDIRQTINVVSPNGRKSELELWSVVSPAFSSVGDKAEWRVTKSGKKVTPLALIVRYNTNEDQEDPGKLTSRLVVVKIDSDSACVTDVVEPVADANMKARELADSSAGKPCVSEDLPEEAADDPGEPDLVIADVADYEKTELPEWKTFASVADLDAAREQKESYTIAYIWKENGTVSRVNFTYFSESGDWVEYWMHTFREDGSLATADHELRTFMDDIIVNRIYTFDEKGELLTEKKTFRDLRTKEFVPPIEYMDIEAGQLYMKASMLPFYSLLNAGSNGAKSENSFIPKGWKQESLTTGDLNGDSTPDSVLQITNENPDDDGNDRSLIILLKNANGTFAKAATADNLLICIGCGGVKGTSPDIEIKDGVLLVWQISGSREYTTYLHRFRLEPTSGKFMLIGEDVSENDGLTGESESTSTNYLTGTQIITKKKYNEKTDKDEVLSTKTVKIEMKKRYIEDVSL